MNPKPPEESQPESSPEKAPIQPDPRFFWTGHHGPPLDLGRVAPPPLPAPLLRRLGDPPGWGKTKSLAETLSSLHQETSARALELFLNREGPRPGARTTP